MTLADSNLIVLLCCVLGILAIAASKVRKEKP